jgi:hypothetical protein
LESSVPAERERKDTEGRSSCQPLSQSFLDEFRSPARPRVPGVSHRVPGLFHKSFDCRELPPSRFTEAEYGSKWRILPSTSMKGLFRVGSTFE